MVISQGSSVVKSQALYLFQVRIIPQLLVHCSLLFLLKSSTDSFSFSDPCMPVFSRTQTLLFSLSVPQWILFTLMIWCITCKFSSIYFRRTQTTSLKWVKANVSTLGFAIDTLKTLCPILKLTIFPCRLNYLTISISILSPQSSQELSLILLSFPKVNWQGITI